MNTIPGLPNIVLVPGLVICTLLVLRTISSFFTLRWIRAVTSLVYIVIVLLIMARFGEPIAEYLQQTVPAQENQQET